MKNDTAFIEQIMPQINFCIKRYGRYISGYDRQDLTNEGIAAGLESLEVWQAFRKSNKTDAVNWAKLAILNRFKELTKNKDNSGNLSYVDLSDDVLSQGVDKFMFQIMFGGEDDSEDQDSGIEDANYLQTLLPKHEDLIKTHFQLGLTLVGTSKHLGKKIQRVSQMKTNFVADAQKVLGS